MLNHYIIYSLEIKKYRKKMKINKKKIKEQI
jgi:hypothetical protein